MKIYEAIFSLLSKWNLIKLKTGVFFRVSLLPLIKSVTVKFQK